MNPLEYLIPHTISPTPNSILEEMKLDAIDSLLSFNSQNTSKRLQDIAEIVSDASQSNKPIGFKELNGLIEGLMVWLLNTPYILINSQGTEGLTPHFKEYIQSNSSTDNNVPFSIASLIQDGCTYTWGGFHGTLAFELYLNRTQNHYLSVSQLVDITVRTLLTRLINSSSSKSRDLTERLLTQLYIDTIEADIEIYRYPVNIIQSIEGIDSSVQLIDNLTLLNDLIHMNSLSNVKEEFRDIYQDLYINLVNYPLNSTTRAFDIFHTNIPKSSIELSTKVYEWCLRTSKALLTTQHNELIEISIDIQKAYSNLSGLNPLILSKNQLLTLPLPGGLNQLIALSALSLLHRAYIMTHPSKVPSLLLQPFQESSSLKYESLLYTGNTFMDQVLGRQKQEGLFSRVTSILYLAGRILRKSNIRDYILMGSNIAYISGWKDTDSTNITTLVD